MESPLTYPILSINSHIGVILRCILHIGLPARKELLLLTRVRDDPSRNSFLASQLPVLLGHESLHTLLHRSALTVYRETLIEDFITLIYDNMLKSSVLSGYLSMHLRNLPLERSNYRQIEMDARRDSFWKEFDATQPENTPSNLNYNVIFREQYGECWNEKIPARPVLAKELHDMFVNWRQRLLRFYRFHRVLSHYLIQDLKEAYLPTVLSEVDGSNVVAKPPRRNGASVRLQIVLYSGV